MRQYSDSCVTVLFHCSDLDIKNFEFAFFAACTSILIFTPDDELQLEDSGTLIKQSNEF